jgi:hypothetical protein
VVKRTKEGCLFVGIFIHIERDEAVTKIQV